MGGERNKTELEDGEPALEAGKLLGSEELPWVAAMDGEGGSSGERVK
jgi:hypothetical protein